MKANRNAESVEKGFILPSGGGGMTKESALLAGSFFHCSPGLDDTFHPCKFNPAIFNVITSGLRLGHYYRSLWVISPM